MKVHEPERTLTITLNEDEIMFLRGITQNALIEEGPRENNIRLSLFVAASRALGYDMNEDGSNIRKGLK